jgi:predicted dienelactone hydrolase
MFRITRVPAAAALAALALVLAPAAASAQPAPNPFERGPAPTAQSIEAGRGPYATEDLEVSDLRTPGFGSAVVTYPTTTADGTFGAVAIVPGYTARESTIAWLRPRIASQGFVVISFNTNSTSDQPAARGEQLLAALDYLVQESAVRDRVDPDRLAVMGHSMGGGGALEAAAERTSIEAAIPLTGWNADKTWPEVQAATLVIGAENDSTAPVARHSIPFYESLTNAEERTYLELNGASHLAPNSPNTIIARYGIAWLKRFVDNDTRYSQFLCPAPRTGTALSGVRSSCPIDESTA